MPNISLRTPHRAKKATSVSSDRAAHPLPHRELRHMPPGRKKRTSAPGKKDAEQSAATSLFSPDFLLLFFVSPRVRIRARTLRAHQSVFDFHLHPFTLPSQPPVALQIRCEGFAPESFTFASPRLLRKKSLPQRPTSHVSRGELCMNVNASPFFRRSTLRFNGLAREGEG